MIDALRRALAEQARIRAERAELDAREAKVRGAIELLREWYPAGGESPTEASDRGLTPPPGVDDGDGSGDHPSLSNGSAAGMPDLAGKNIRDAAVAVLGERRGSWMHAKEVAERAISLGYRSSRPDSTNDKTIKSFRDILRNLAEQTPDEIEREGTNYRLRE